MLAKVLFRVKRRERLAAGRLSGLPIRGRVLPVPQRHSCTVKAAVASNKRPYKSDSQGARRAGTGSRSGPCSHRMQQQQQRVAPPPRSRNGFGDLEEEITIAHKAGAEPNSGGGRSEKEARVRYEAKRTAAEAVMQDWAKSRKGFEMRGCTRMRIKQAGVLLFAHAPRRIAGTAARHFRRYRLFFFNRLSLVRWR